MADQPPRPSFMDSLFSIGSLVVLLALSVFLFGEDSSSGGNQIALSLGALITVLIGLKNGHRWKDIEESIVAGVSISIQAIMILFAVGTLVGSWILSGTVPTMVYYGLILLDPNFFYPATCIICALVALSVGSSWTVASTIGIGLMGAAAGLGLSLEITAGAIISGAYFGDKMSPLSETTNLAPAVTGTDLFTHIRHMVWTTTPSILIAIVLFSLIGVGEETQDSVATLNQTLMLLDDSFSIHIGVLMPLALVLFLAIKKVPALPTILAGTFLGCVCALIFQSAALSQLAADDGMPKALAVIKALWQVLANGYVSNTGNEGIDSLLSRGGMSSMLNTVWLIIAAMVFGAVVEKVGVLQRLVDAILTFVSSTGNLIVTTLATCIGVNILTGDQYMAIVLPGRMYKLEFERRGLDAKNLSRALEDAATITSPLVPWNTCGAFMAATLGVATFAYLPYCFFNLINPFVSAIYGYTGFKIETIDNTSSIESDTGHMQYSK